jgi:hypothetical protein
MTACAVNPQQDSPAQLPVQSPRYLCTISSLQQSSVWKTVGFTTVQDIIMLIANVQLFKYVHLPSIEHFEKTCKDLHRSINPLVANDLLLEALLVSAK